MTGSLLLAPARRQGHHHTTAGRDPIGGPPGSGKAIITPPWPVSNWWLAGQKRGNYLLAATKRTRWAPVRPGGAAPAGGRWGGGGGGGVGGGGGGGGGWRGGCVPLLGAGRPPGR